MPASVLERDVLPARVRGYTPRLLDELGAAGEVVWIGRGSLGRDDGRVALYPPRPRRLLPRPAPGARRTGRPEPPARRDPAAPSAPGRLVLPRSCEPPAIPTPATTTSCSTRCGISSGSGEVTNDTFAALRALSLPRSRSRDSPRPGRLRRSGRRAPPGAGRWSPISSARALADRARARPRHGAARAPRRRDPRGGAGRGAGRWLRIGLPGPASDGGVGRGRARLLRGRARGGAVRAARAVDRLRAERDVDETSGPQGPAGRGRSGAAVRRRAAVAAGKGRRPAAAAARGGRLRGAGRR